MQKLVVSSMILMLVTLGWSDSGRGEQPPAPKGELRIVDRHPDNFVSIVLNVIEELMTLDQQGHLVPRLATRWQWLDDRTLEVQLRQGVTFHNGEVFDAEIVKLNFEGTLQFPQPHRGGAWLNFQPGSRLEILDPYTVRFIFPEPDGGALVKLSIMHMANRPDGLSLTLIAPEELEVQATVVSKMLEQGGFRVDLQVLTPDAFNRRTHLNRLEQPAEQQAWDIALRSLADILNFPPFLLYTRLAIGGVLDWGSQSPALWQLREHVLRTVDRKQQQGLIRQLERHVYEQASFLFLYNPIQLYAVNKAVEFVPYVTTLLNLDETLVTKQHRSVREAQGDGAKANASTRSR